MDLNTFVTTLYAHADDFIHQHAPQIAQERQVTSLSPSEIITLALLAHAPRFTSERDFYRFADRSLRAYFPRLPHYSQYNRLVRRHCLLLGQYGHYLAATLCLPSDIFEAMDGSAVPIRHVQRRGNSWLWGQAAKGRGGRIGWFYGFVVLISVTPSGVITGFGFAPGNTKDQTLATTFLAARADQHPRMACVGPKRDAVYLTDKGFGGRTSHWTWHNLLEAEVITPPSSKSRVRWSKQWHHLVAHLRQIVETAFGRLHPVLGLDHERPHALDGFFARLTARVAMSNFAIQVNRQQERPDLEYVELFAW